MYLETARRRGENHGFPVNTFLVVKRYQDVQLASALANDKEYVAKAKKLKRLETKVISSVKFSLLFGSRYWNKVMRSLVLIIVELNFILFPFRLSPINLYKSSQLH